MDVRTARRRSRLALLAVATALLAAPLGVGTATAATSSTGFSPEDFRVIAHRGLHTPKYDENTVQSQLAAMDQGATCVETDLRITKDGQFVQVHDPTVDRTTNGTGWVYQLSFAYIRSLVTDKAQQQVPTLEETLQALAPLGGCLHAEITGAWWSETKLRQMRDLVVAYGMADRFFPYSANKDLLRTMRVVTPELSTIWKAFEPVDDSDIADLGVSGVVPRIEQLTPDTISRMHALGVKIFSPGANSQDKWEALVALGCDGLMTNKTKAFVRWYGGIGSTG
jgi:glycerophosphoryl diester phosphodiesterase